LKSHYSSGRERFSRARRVFGLKNVPAPETLTAKYPGVQLRVPGHLTIVFRITIKIV